MIYELPSITFFFVVVDFVASRFVKRPLMSAYERAVLFILIGVAGVILSVTTVGSPALNVYGLGFSGFASVVLATTGIVIARRAPSLAILALVAIAACELHVYRSRNLFDYVIDPWVVFVAWGYCVVLVWRALRSTSRGSFARRS